MILFIFLYYASSIFISIWRNQSEQTFNIRFGHIFYLHSLIILSTNSMIATIFYCLVFFSIFILFFSFFFKQLRREFFDPWRRRSIERKLTPRDWRCSLGPIPESIKICGELTDPPDRITSLLALITCFRPSRIKETPTAFLSSIRIWTDRHFL